MIKIGEDYITFEEFPNKEVLLKNHYDIIESNLIHTLDEHKGFIDSLNILFKFESNSSLFELYLLKKEIDEVFDGIDKVRLWMMYCPYSRMDRGNSTTCFSLEYLAKFINELNFCSVEIYEPHSDVCISLINNSNEKWITPYLFQNFIKDCNFDPEKDGILFPDKGAMNRYSKILDRYIPPSTSIMFGEKKRDFDTGRIEGLLITPPIKKIDRCIIIDDLCSYGGTFKLAIETLEKMGIKEIYLIIGHCESSILKGGLLGMDSLKKVFTTNSIINEENASEKLDILKVI